LQHAINTKLFAAWPVRKKKKRFEMIERVYAERFCQSMTDSNFADACIKDNLLILL
jgi:hypothetical protein